MQAHMSGHGMSDAHTEFLSLLDNPKFASFFKAWDCLRVDEQVPDRNAVRLQDFAPFASELLMYELESPSVLRCRLMGSAISDRVQVNGQSINWLDLVSQDCREAGEAWWSSLLAVPCAGIMQFSTAFLDGTNRLGRALLLPLRRSNGGMMLMAMSKASTVYRVDPPRDALLIAAECFQTRYIDIGFGLPKIESPVNHVKILDEQTLERITFK